MPWNYLFKLCHWHNETHASGSSCVMMADGHETSVKIILDIYYAISTIRKVQHGKP